MNDRVVGVEQDPIAMRQAFDARGDEAAGFQGLNEPVGNRADMDVGSSGCDDHEISEGGLAAQIDRDDVFRLGVFKTSRDRLGERADFGFDGTGSRGQRLGGRFKRQR